MGIFNTLFGGDSTQQDIENFTKNVSNNAIESLIQSTLSVTDSTELVQTVQVDCNQVKSEAFNAIVNLSSMVGAGATTAQIEAYTTALRGITDLAECGADGIVLKSTLNKAQTSQLVSSITESNRQNLTNTINQAIETESPGFAQLLTGADTSVKNYVENIVNALIVSATDIRAEIDSLTRTVQSVGVTGAVASNISVSNTQRIVSQLFLDSTVVKSNFQDIKNTIDQSATVVNDTVVWIIIGAIVLILGVFLLRWLSNRYIDTKSPQRGEQNSKGEKVKDMVVNAFDALKRGKRSPNKEENHFENLKDRAVAMIDNVRAQTGGNKVNGKKAKDILVDKVKDHFFKKKEEKPTKKEDKKKTQVEEVLKKFQERIRKILGPAAAAGAVAVGSKSKNKNKNSRRIVESSLAVEDKAQIEDEVEDQVNNVQNKGLKFKKNSCFMDSPLMALFWGNTVDFKFPEEVGYEENNSDKENLLQYLKKLAQYLKDDSSKVNNYYSEKTLRYLMAKAGASQQYINGGQADPGEFLEYILELIGYGKAFTKTIEYDFSFDANGTDTFESEVHPHKEEKDVPPVIKLPGTRESISLNLKYMSDFEERKTHNADYYVQTTETYEAKNKELNDLIIFQIPVGDNSKYTPKDQFEGKDLTAVVVHLTDNHMGGHYVAYLKDVKNTDWYYYNDTIQNGVPQIVAHGSISALLESLENDDKQILLTRSRLLFYRNTNINVEVLVKDLEEQEAIKRQAAKKPNNDREFAEREPKIGSNKKISEKPEGREVKRDILKNMTPNEKRVYAFSKALAALQKKTKTG